MLETITPPAPKAAAPAPAPEPKIETPPVVETPPVDTSKLSLTEKIQHAAALATKPAETKAEAAKPAAAAAPTTTEDSDEALNKEIESKTKNWQPGEKKSFTEKTYALRDATRKLKELAPLKDKVTDLETKLAAAEAAGKNTTDLEAKLKTAEDKLAAASAVDPAEVEGYKTKLTAAEKRQSELEQELQVAAVEKSNEWKSAITKPKEKIAEQIADLAKKHELNPRSLQNALYGTAEEQAAAVEALTGPEQAKFFNLAIRAQEIDERADTLRTNAAEANTKIQAKREQETAQQKADRQNAFKTASTEAWNSVKEAFPFLAPADGATEWNKSIADAEAFVRDTDVASLDAKAASQVLARAAVVPHLRGALAAKETALTEMEAKLTEALAKVAKFEANRPGAEHTPKDGDDAKPEIKATGAAGTAARIQAAIHGRS